MTEDRDHIGDELAALALGSLDEMERGRVQAHIDTCDTCAEQLMEFRAVVGVLPLALPHVSPPAEAWTTIQTAARRRGPPAWRSIVRQGGWTRVARWSAAAALAGGLLVWNVSLQREVWRYAEGPQVEKLARRPGRLVILAGTSRPQASARLFAAVDGLSGHLAVSGLSPAPRRTCLSLVVSAPRRAVGHRGHVHSRCGRSGLGGRRRPGAAGGDSRDHRH